MTKADMMKIADATAARHGLDPALVKAVCHHESAGWNTWASRYEPGFYTRYIVPMPNAQRFGTVVSDGTERRARATSYGLMQVMGQVAREQGFTGEYLTEMCDPAVGIEQGCHRLKAAMNRAGGDVRKALLSYNGGGNPDYPDLVLKHYPEYKQ